MGLLRIIHLGCSRIAFNTEYDIQNIADLIRNGEKQYSAVEKYSKARFRQTIRAFGITVK